MKARRDLRATWLCAFSLIVVSAFAACGEYDEDNGDGDGFGCERLCFDLESCDPTTFFHIFTSDGDCADACEEVDANEDIRCMYQCAINTYQCDSFNDCVDECRDY